MTRLCLLYENEPLKVRNLSVLQMPLEEPEEKRPRLGNEPTVARVVSLQHAARPSNRSPSVSTTT